MGLHGLGEGAGRQHDVPLEDLALAGLSLMLRLLVVVKQLSILNSNCLLAPICLAVVEIGSLEILV